MSKDTEKATPLDNHTVKAQLFWGNVMLVLAIICYVIGCITVFGDIEAMKNLGFISVFFLGTFFLALWLYLRSNALDTVQDKKAVPIDLSLFTSDRGFTIGSIAVVLVLVILYITLW